MSFHRFITSQFRSIIVRRITPVAGLPANTRLRCIHRAASPCQLLSLTAQLNCTQAPRRHLWGMLNAVFNKPDRSRIEEVGPQRACAEWLLRCGAHVRWQGINKFLQDYNSLPSGPFQNFKIEEVNADDAAVMAIGFAHFDGVDSLKKIRFHHCAYFYDDAVFALAALKSSLQHLEISSCGDVSDEGLASLAQLTNLNTLILYDLPGVRHKEDALKKLQEALPNCNIDFKDIQNKPA